jgi:hypothetical protein
MKGVEGRWDETKLKRALATTDSARGAGICLIISLASGASWGWAGRGGVGSCQPLRAASYAFSNAIQLIQYPDHKLTFGAQARYHVGPKETIRELIQRRSGCDSFGLGSQSVLWGSYGCLRPHSCQTSCHVIVWLETGLDWWIYWTLTGRNYQ